MGDDFGAGSCGSGGTALALAAVSALAFAAAMPLACSISSITSSFIIRTSPLASLRIASALPGAGSGERFPRLGLCCPVLGEYSMVLGVLGLDLGCPVLGEYSLVLGVFCFPVPGFGAGDSGTTIGTGPWLDDDGRCVAGC